MFTGQKRKGIDMEIAPAIVAFYTFLTGLLVGWTIPRGSSLKRLQANIRKLLRK